MNIWKNLIHFVMLSLNITQIILVNSFNYYIMVIIGVEILLYFYIMRGCKNLNLLREEQVLQIENLELQNKNLTIMYDNIRGFKHDYANFIQCLNGYIQINNMEGIKKMCDSAFKEFNTVKNLEILDPDIINNPPIYSILTNKYYQALEKEVTMNIEVLIDLEDIKDDIYEICRILAILLDNAIEAASKCEDKVVNVRFIKDYSYNRKLIIVENTYSQKNIDIGKIFEKGYTTKDNENDEHGLGLWTVRKILTKNKKLNLDTNKDEYFCQRLEIYQ